MARRVEEALSQAELERLYGMQNEMRDVHLASLEFTVSHIECGERDGVVEIKTYESLENPYFRLFLRKEKPPELPPDELAQKRKEIADQTKGDRRKTLEAALKVRSNDVDVHKYYLSETMRDDVGIVIATAHWLKDVSKNFYEKSEADYAAACSEFKWSGMERAFVIAAPDKQGVVQHYTIADYQDMFIEENFAQYLGIVRNASCEQIHEKAAAARQLLTAMHANPRICVLGCPAKS